MVVVLFRTYRKDLFKKGEKMKAEELRNKMDYRKKLRIGYMSNMKQKYRRLVLGEVKERDNGVTYTNTSGKHQHLAIGIVKSYNTDDFKPKFDFLICNRGTIKLTGIELTVIKKSSDDWFYYFERVVPTDGTYQLIGNMEYVFLVGLDNEN